MEISKERKLAIAILQWLDDNTTLDLEGMLYYELEDAITEIIKKYK